MGCSRARVVRFHTNALTLLILCALLLYLLLLLNVDRLFTAEFVHLSAAPAIAGNDSTAASNAGHYLYSTMELGGQSGLAKLVPFPDKFICTSPVNTQLGNQMYKFASLFAMGQLLARTPVYLATELALRAMEPELADVFPNFRRRILYLRDNVTDRRVEVPFVFGCCVFKEPRQLMLYDNATVLQLVSGTNFEHYRYIWHAKATIANELFKFSDKLERRVRRKWSRLLSSAEEDHSSSSPPPPPHRRHLCVHIRRADFVGWLGESDKSQTEAAVRLVLANISSSWQTGNRSSLLLFGDDPKFLRALRLPKNVPVHFVPELGLSRGEELFLASMGCHSFLITAPLSSFAFWMAFLMQAHWPAGPVYFIHKTFTKLEIPIDTGHILPPEWRPIEQKELDSVG